MGKLVSCYNLKMRQASRVITNHYDSYLRPNGITVTQFSILRALWYLKSTSQKDLQEVLVLQQTTLTRNLKPLIRDHYIQITPSPKDGRIKLVSLSDEGKALFENARKNWKQAQTALSNRLGKEKSEQLIELADAIIEIG